MRAGQTALGLNCLREPEREHGFEPLSVSQGQIPDGLDGMLYRVGPGRFADRVGAYPHWFDGEGLLTALQLGNGQAELACRMVRPRGHGQPDYALRGRMGRAPQGFLRRLQSFADRQAYVNVANTALMQWQDRLFALFEASLPTEIDPNTLETLSETDLNVIVRSFGAHPHVHGPSDTIINQGFRPPPKAGIDYYALPPAGLPQRTHYVPISGRFPAHDLAVTESKIVTVLSPIYIDVKGIIAGRAIADCLEWRPEAQTECVVTPVGGGDAVILKTDPMLYSHTANAYDADDSTIVQGVAAPDASLVDWTARVKYDAGNLEPLPSPGRLTELKIDMGARKAEVETLFDTPMEFPTVDPRWSGKRHRVVYATGYQQDATAYADFSDSIVRFDLERGQVDKLDFGEGHVVSEPIFLPDGPQEGEGWLLCQNYDANADESYIAIVRAGSEMDVVALLPLPQRLPMSLHGLWVPQP